MVGSGIFFKSEFNFLIIYSYYVITFFPSKIVRKNKFPSITTVYLYNVIKSLPFVNFHRVLTKQQISHCSVKYALLSSFVSHIEIVNENGFFVETF